MCLNITHKCRLYPVINVKTLSRFLLISHESAKLLTINFIYGLTTMNQDDFRCMRRGKTLATLSPQEKQLLTGFRQCNEHKNKALLLLHGFSSSPAVFRILFPYLIHYDAIIAPTLPGHGDSLTTFSKTKASDWIRAAEQACAVLCQDYTSVDVLGLSLGGLLACHLSQRFSLNHLYLLAPALDLHLSLPLILPLVSFFQSLGFERLRTKAGNLHADHYCEVAYRQLPLNAINEVLTLIKQFQFSLPECPTDVFLGKYDEVVNSELVAARFPLSDLVRIHWLENSAHVLPLDGDIERIIKQLQQP